MLYIKKITILPFLIALLTLISIFSWSGITIFGTYIAWMISFMTVICVFWYKTTFFHPANIKDYRIVIIYLIWTIIGIIRGAFIADSYWEWKQLINGTLSLLLPIFVYAFSIPFILQNVLRIWMIYILPIFLLLFIWITPLTIYHFCISPIFLLGCFLPILPKLWKNILLLLLILMLVGDLGARAQVLKAGISLIIALGIYFRKHLPISLLKKIHSLFYIISVILLVLGISGLYNILDAGAQKYNGKYEQVRINNGEIEHEDLSADTRSFIYEEVITSAIRHNYVLCGRTPARGNDSMIFGSLQAENLKTGKYERHYNEVCHPNVFTWLGLIGLILWCLIYKKFLSGYLQIK